MKTVFISDNREIYTRKIAAYLLGEGYNVVVNETGGEKAEGCGTVSLNLNDITAVQSFLGGLGESLWGVVHPAPLPIRVSIEDADDASWERGFDEGALPAMLLTHAAGEAMAKYGRGRIIYLGSIHAEKPTGFSFIYSLGCSAVQMLCREAALDYGTKGICCFYVQRPVMETDLKNKNNLSNIYSAPELHYPMQKLPAPDSLNGLIAFLLTEAAAPLNGEDLRADGGMTMYYGRQKEG